MNALSKRSVRRRGSVYVVVLGASLVVGMTALAAMSLGRVELRDAATTEDVRNARRAAMSGIEYALNVLNNDPDWRTTLVCCEEQPQVLLGIGYFKWRVSDVDSDLADDPRDHATVVVTGYGLTAVAVEQVDVEPSGEVGVSCLGAGVFADQFLQIESGARLAGSGFAHSNDYAELSSAQSDIDIDTVGSANGGNYNAGRYESVDPLRAPGEHVFDWYQKRGTWIPISAITNVFGTRTMLGRLLSPQHNPYGDANPWGIYVIDCEGQNLSISGSRVLGTLVLLNPGPSSGITDVVHMQPLGPNYPSLMVDGATFRFDMAQLLTNSRTLSEGGGVNFNPPGAPYLSLTDSDTSDSYPSRIEGLVYVTGQARITDNSDFVGALMAGSAFVQANQTLTITHQRYAIDYPPPGFSAGPGVRALPGSFLKASR
ncbi:MAG: hypothetical protein ACRCT8_16000 [Lacipirellulaceae bacterium]